MRDSNTGFYNGAPERPGSYRASVPGAAGPRKLEGLCQERGTDTRYLAALSLRYQLKRAASTGIC